MPYTVLSHTADTGIEATAPSLSDLIEVLAAGMFGLMAQVEKCPPDRRVTAKVKATSAEELVVDTLSDLIYRSEVEDLFLCDFEVRTAGDSGVEVTASGVEAASVELVGAPIKAVTYHGLTVERTDQGWYGRVYFDV